MSVSASIVTYRTPDDELRQCLGSLPCEHVRRIYVVDNSRSRSTQHLCGEYPHVEYIGNDNRGYGAAHNIAFAKSIADGTKYQLVLNPDICFNPDTIPALTRYMDLNPDTGMVQPKIVNPDGSLQYTVRMLPTPWDLILRRFVPQKLFTARRHRYELRHLNHDQEFDVPYHQGSFMLIRTEALQNTGGFDERFFMYPEDIDLTRRIHERYRTMYVPIATVVHKHRAASYTSLRMLYIHIVNMIRYFNKWGWIFDKSRKDINRKLM